jgi:hypothetical protein
LTTFVPVSPTFRPQRELPVCPTALSLHNDSSFRRFAPWPPHAPLPARVVTRELSRKQLAFAKFLRATRHCAIARAMRLPRFAVTMLPKNNSQTVAAQRVAGRVRGGRPQTQAPAHRTANRPIVRGVRHNRTPAPHRQASRPVIWATFFLIAGLHNAGLHNAMGAIRLHRRLQP